MFAKAVFAALKLLVSLELGWGGWRVGWGLGNSQWSWEMKGKLSLHKQWVDFFSFSLITKESHGSFSPNAGCLVEAVQTASLQDCLHYTSQSTRRLDELLDFDSTHGPPIALHIS